MSGREKLRQKIIRDTNRQIAEFEQVICDVEYWNSINPNETPFDCGLERVLIVFARKILADAVCGKRINPEWNRRMIEALEAADLGLVNQSQSEQGG